MKVRSAASFLFAFSLLVCLTSVDTNAEESPLKVFVLVGQSNMQGHAHVRTLEHIGMDPKTAPLLRDIQNDDGTPKVHKDVWITYLSSGGEKKGQLSTGFGADENKIGPELTFGITMQRLVGEPILIIKTAWGGKSLHTDFRPPSAGPYEFSQSQLEQFAKQDKDVEQLKKERTEASGHYYRLTVEHVKKVLGNIKEVYPDYNEDQGYELAGMVWFQGWNDMVDRGVYPNRDKQGGYGDYSKIFVKFIHEIREDLSAPEMPFVIGVMGAGGPTSKYVGGQVRYQGIHQNFRDAMAAPASLPEFQGNVATVLTENYWDMDLVELRRRESELKEQIKTLETEKNLSGDELKAESERLRSEAFTPIEQKTLQVAVSNFEFHYLGSSKIMAQIGKGFAEATHELMKD